ncbi:MAG: SPOR domain-containing protein [Arenibacter sp.]|nr:SPOR domain-containing protein [Arenibacter sp.]
MGTEFYIAELLYRYNCVMVPEFGAFLTQMESAVINEHNNTFVPPRKSISFNGQLRSNDGLLVSYMAEAERTSYEEMQQKIALVSQEWTQRLEAGEELRFPNLGVLWRNNEGKTQFQPSNEVNYLTSSFGLSSFVAAPIQREVMKEEVAALEENIPFTITPEARKYRSNRPYFKYAAVVLLAVATSFTGYRLYNENVTTQQLVRQEAQQQVSKNIQEATFFNTAPLELPVISLSISTPKKKESHQIIAGAFRVKGNAEKKVTQLKGKGYNASYIGENEYGLHMVAYGTYDDAEVALKELRKIKTSESSEAWMRSVK